MNNERTHIPGQVDRAGWRRLFWPVKRAAIPARRETRQRLVRGLCVPLFLAHGMGERIQRTRPLARPPRRTKIFQLALFQRLPPLATIARPLHGRRSALKSRSAFTLVEVIAAIVIIGTLGGLSGTILFQGVEGYRGVAVGGELHADLASAMDRIDRAIREVPSLAGNGISSIKEVTPTSIDWDETGGGAKILLFAGSLLLGYEGADGTALISGVTAFSVRCYDEGNAALAASLSGAAVNNIRRIEITITAAREGLTDTLRTRIYLRCTMVGTN